MMYRQLIILILISLTFTGALSGVGKAPTEAVISGLDESDRSSLEKQSPRTLKKIDNGESISTEDIKKMVRAGISDEVIISQIDATQSVFYLSSADIVDLKRSGVSQRVINHMIQTGNQ